MPPDTDDWDGRKDQIIGLGERSFRKSYYPQLRENLDRLERFRTLLDRTTDCVVMVALPEGDVSDANAALGRLLGQPTASLLGRPFASLGLGDAADVLETLRREAQSAASLAELPAHSDITEFVRDGRTIWLELSYRLAVLDGRSYGVIVGRDVTERKLAQDMADALLAEKEALLDNALVGIAMVRNRRIVLCNRRMEEIFGYPMGGMNGHSTRILYESDEAFRDVGSEAYGRLGQGRTFSVSQPMARADGSHFWGELAGRCIDPEHPDDGSIWILSDITERKRAEERAEFLSYHDALTGLPNQLLLKDRLQQAIAFSNTTGTKIALLILDLDRFKTINDFLGHAAGDRLLVNVAGRLLKRVRKTDTVSRQGGDEFHLLLTNLAEPDAIVTFLGELMDSMQQPYAIEGKELTISVSVGIAIYPEDGADFQALLKRADMAMYRAKDSGRNAYRFFNQEMNEDAVEQITMHAGLWRAVEAEQFVLHYQPQFDLRSGRLIGAEALIRWNHPDLGLVSPGRFIPVAEEAGLIVQIGDWVLREACREAARWRDAGAPGLVIAVNLSAVQFKRGDIERSVARALADSGLAPEQLELELTESILIRDSEHMLSTVKRLKHMGIKLSIDDFGTGYSSLSYLKRFEVDKLKIDQTFVRDLVSNPEDAAIVRAIIQMAHSLGLKTIAEGVETQQVLDTLGGYECDEVQGFWCGRPVPAEAFAAFLAGPP
ncbi:putative bifunctional diguanylate cyclase/phosphodiesterase [Propionivibrio sp.]|uniref:putative bifunctional diguanylate cyclase/phosphodiesterase n=1 Tax=Propionivibrio sp. TaxID=2212460 RepID=UPI0039E275C3